MSDFTEVIKAINSIDDLQDISTKLSNLINDLYDNEGNVKYDNITEGYNLSQALLENKQEILNTVDSMKDNSDETEYIFGEIHSSFISFDMMYKPEMEKIPEVEVMAEQTEIGENTNKEMDNAKSDSVAEEETMTDNAPTVPIKSPEEFEEKINEIIAVKGMLEITEKTDDFEDARDIYNENHDFINDVIDKREMIQESFSNAEDKINEIYTAIEENELKSFFNEPFDSHIQVATEDKMMNETDIKDKEEISLNIEDNSSGINEHEDVINNNDTNEDNNVNIEKEDKTDDTEISDATLIEKTVYERTCDILGVDMNGPKSFAVRTDKEGNPVVGKNGKPIDYSFEIRFVPKVDLDFVNSAIDYSSIFVGKVTEKSGTEHVCVGMTGVKDDGTADFSNCHINWMGDAKEIDRQEKFFHRNGEAGSGNDIAIYESKGSHLSEKLDTKYSLGDLYGKIATSDSIGGIDLKLKEAEKMENAAVNIGYNAELYGKTTIHGIIDGTINEAKDANLVIAGKIQALANEIKSEGDVIFKNSGLALENINSQIGYYSYFETQKDMGERDNKIVPLNIVAEINKMDNLSERLDKIILMYDELKGYEAAPTYIDDVEKSLVMLIDKYNAIADDDCQVIIKDGVIHNSDNATYAAAVIGDGIIDNPDDYPSYVLSKDGGQSISEFAQYEAFGEKQDKSAYGDDNITAFYSLSERNIYVENHIMELGEIYEEALVENKYKNSDMAERVKGIEADKKALYDKYFGNYEKVKPQDMPAFLLEACKGYEKEVLEYAGIQQVDNDKDEVAKDSDKGKNMNVVKNLYDEINSKYKEQTAKLGHLAYGDVGVLILNAGRALTGLILGETKCTYQKYEVETGQMVKATLQYSMGDVFLSAYQVLTANPNAIVNAAMFRAIYYVCEHTIDIAIRNLAANKTTDDDSNTITKEHEDNNVELPEISIDDIPDEYIESDDTDNTSDNVSLDNTDETDKLEDATAAELKEEMLNDMESNETSEGNTDEADVLIEEKDIDYDKEAENQETEDDLTQDINTEINTEDEMDKKDSIGVGDVKNEMEKTGNEKDSLSEKTEINHISLDEGKKDNDNASLDNNLDKEEHTKNITTQEEFRNTQVVEDAANNMNVLEGNKDALEQNIENVAIEPIQDDKKDILPDVSQDTMSLGNNDESNDLETGQGSEDILTKGINEEYEENIQTENAAESEEDDDYSREDIENENYSYSGEATSNEEIMDNIDKKLDDIINEYVAYSESGIEWSITEAVTYVGVDEQNIKDAVSDKLSELINKAGETGTGVEDTIEKAAYIGIELVNNSALNMDYLDLLDDIGGKIEKNDIREKFEDKISEASEKFEEDKVKSTDDIIYSAEVSLDGHITSIEVIADEYGNPIDKELLLDGEVGMNLLATDEMVSVIDTEIPNIVANSVTDNMLDKFEAEIGDFLKDKATELDTKYDTANQDNTAITTKEEMYAEDKTTGADNKEIVDKLFELKDNLHHYISVGEEITSFLQSPETFLEEKAKSAIASELNDLISNITGVDIKDEINNIKCEIEDKIKECLKNLISEPQDEIKDVANENMTGMIESFQNGIMDNITADIVGENAIAAGSEMAVDAAEVVAEGAIDGAAEAGLAATGVGAPVAAALAVAEVFDASDISSS